MAIRLLRNTPLAETGHLIAAYEMALRALRSGGSQRSTDYNDRKEGLRDRRNRPQRPGRNIEARREVAHVQLGWFQ